MIALHIKAEWCCRSYSKWRRMVRGNWNDSSTDSDTESWILVVRLWCRLTQV